MKYKLPILAFACMASISASAQVQGDVYRQYNDAEVKGYNSTIKTLAWAGGMNNPQFAMADLNRDGRKDMVVYERGLNVKTFIATSNGQYEYNNAYEASFNGHNINGYFKLIDYNGDDIPDMIHRSYSGVGVFRGYYDDNVLKFKYYKDLYYFTQGSGNVNLYVEPNDIPGMADVDNDGDLDIVSYGIWGSTITMYKNCQVEEGLPKDSIKICLEDDCWGKTIQYYERTQGLGYSCAQVYRTCNKTTKTTHSGNTLCLVDMDNDGDKDYFNGNISYPDIQFLTNGRIPYRPKTDSVIAQDTLWGAGGKDMFMPVFPAAFAEDVNHDGKFDLLFSPNSFATENYKCASYYKNTGTPNAPAFTYQSDTFMIADMIDKGTAAYPVFYDFDKDGLKDLFIGSEGYYQHANGTLKSSISYYKNTSTSSGYSFELQTDDFLGLFSTNIQGTAIAIGDLDNDSLDDLVIGRSDGTFAFYKNYAASKNDAPDWKLEIANLRDNQSAITLDVGDYATPAIYDINNDGKNDLVSGNQTGDLYYYENFTVPSAKVTFKKVSTNFGGVKIYDSFQAYAYSAPYIGPIDNTGKDYLMIGCYWGELFRYDGFQNGAMPSQLTKLDSTYSYIKVPERSTPAFANVDNDADNLYEMVVGNVLGGVNFYKQDFRVFIDDKFVNEMDVIVYPNPAKDVMTISWNKQATQGNVNVELVSVTGQRIVSKTFNAAEEKGSLETGGISSGTYYCIIMNNGNKIVKPITILK